MMNHATSVSPTISDTDYRSDSVSRQCCRGMLHIVLVVTLTALLALPPGIGYARDHKDHERARKALMSGDVLSLRQVLDLVNRQYPGEPVEIEFEDDDGVYVYEIKLLQPAGSVLKMKVDATTGKVIKVKGRGIERRNDD